MKFVPYRIDPGCEFLEKDESCPTTTCDRCPHMQYYEKAKREYMKIHNELMKKRGRKVSD